MESGILLKKLSTVEEMLPHYDLIAQLSPQLSMEQYRELLTIMVGRSYYQVAAYENGRCVGVSGYWLGAKLYSGKYLEIDNFIVEASSRHKGIGKLLVDWMVAEAKAQGCETVMLDAYVENFTAHKFYYRQGFVARGFHYLKKISE